MKRLIVSAALAIAVAASAHNPPGELFFAVQFPDDLVPTPDGDLSDWNIVPADPYAIHNDLLFSPDADIQAVGRGEIDASDINIMEMFGWNKDLNKLYFATQVFDNIHNTDRANAAAFYQDDAVEIEVNPDHTATADHNPSDGPANNFSYKWAVPPIDGQYQFFRPNAGLAWFVDGSDWIHFGWSYTGDEFGESTYYYELAITPIQAMPRGDNVTADQTIVHNLTENEIFHISENIGDVDQGDEYRGFWGLSPESCCTATDDFVMAPVEPSIAALSGGQTAVQAVTWGQIKAGF